MTNAELDEIERVAKGAESDDEWAKDRTALTWTPESPGRCAKVWYDDDDLCANITGNLGMGFGANQWAEFFATCSPDKVLALVEMARRANPPADDGEPRAGDGEGRGDE